MRLQIDKKEMYYNHKNMNKIEIFFQKVGNDFIGK